MIPGFKLTAEVPPEELTEHRFPCEQCGAMLQFSAGQGKLECAYCGHQNPIVVSAQVIHEYAFHEALQELERAPPASVSRHVKCTSCAAAFEFDEDVHSGECPFCGTVVVTETGVSRRLKPRSLLPFKVERRVARESFQRWLKSLWFAPGSVKKYAREEGKLAGVYLPYWTYDSDTVSAYNGRRGTAHHRRENYTAVVAGKRVRRSRVITEIRWHPVSGRVSRHFDDVLIGATRSLPRKITDKLGPWDLPNLVPYSEQYLSGFRSEVYQVALDEGFEHARQIMDTIIRQDVRRSIGGDQQRVSDIRTRHSSTTFKHILLPVWSAAFSFRGKVYRFVVNGRTGVVQGERPYSAIKIGLVVIAVAIAVGLIATFAMQQNGVQFQFSY